MAIAAPNTSTTTTAPGTGQSYRRSAGHGDHALLHVGISHLPERHSGSASEIDFRPELFRGHVDSVCFFWGLLYFLDSFGQDHRLDRLPAVDGCGSAYDGPGSVSVCAGRQCSVLSVIPGCVDRAGCGNHVPAGGGESVRHGVGEARDSFKPAQSDAGVQLPGNFSGAFLRRPADSDSGAEVH